MLASLGAVAEDIQEHPDIPDEMSEGEFDEKVIGGNLVKKPPEHIGVFCSNRAIRSLLTFAQLRLSITIHCSPRRIALMVTLLKPLRPVASMFVWDKKNWKFCAKDLARSFE